MDGPHSGSQAARQGTRKWKAAWHRISWHFAHCMCTALSLLMHFFYICVYLYLYIWSPVATADQARQLDAIRALHMLVSRRRVAFFLSTSLPRCESRGCITACKSPMWWHCVRFGVLRQKKKRRNENKTSRTTACKRLSRCVLWFLTCVIKVNGHDGDVPVST